MWETFHEKGLKFQTKEPQPNSRDLIKNNFKKKKKRYIYTYYKKTGSIATFFFPPNLKTTTIGYLIQCF